MSEEQAEEKDEEVSPALERFMEMVKELTREEQLQVRRRLLEMVEQDERAKR